MEEQLLLTNLYDYYSLLLTDKQKIYFEDYFFNNLTLQEMSENYTISRNAIHKQLKDVKEKLYDYENKLELYKKSNKIKVLITNLDNDIKNQIEELI